MSLLRRNLPRKPRTRPDHGLPPEFVREATMNQIKRLIHGIYAFPIVVAFVGVMGYAADHPLLFWTSAAAVVVAVGMRIVLALTMRSVRPGLFAWLLPLNVCLAWGPIGLLLVSALGSYGLQNWTFIAALIWTVGAVSASTIAYAPNLRVLQLNVGLLLGPTLVRSLIIGGPNGKALALMVFLLCLFQLLNGRRMYMEYWQKLHNRAMESARSRELEIAKIAAEAASTSKGQFLANMSHEIRTPMHGILGMAQLALNAETPQESREYVATLRNSAEGLLHVLSEILDFSKVEAGKLDMENIPSALRQSLDEVRKIVLPHELANKLLLECNIDGDVPDLLTGDPTRLRQGLLNLMGNAIKFTESGSVRLHLAPDPTVPITRQPTPLFRV